MDSSPLMAYFASHCNGLYASPSYDGYCILNPSTRESIPLPRAHSSVKFSPLSVAIGFDPSRSKYKVVVIYRQRAVDDQSDLSHTEEELPVDCHVITLGTSSWGTISSKPIIRACLDHRHPTTVNGTLYWSIGLLQVVKL
ncbi:hypothetical protein FRX31_030156 [Thalictrum thalictroides]|uniref:F-box associated beta-propeller type 3 domain-containing protein n=1 Tax=Thalictrum thalictroides TaxID=46969 RepID=A0A7J6V666_THATH|nr:hypothetical protein FRX31_030156 [Thalictrum thalictroides]